MSLQILSIASLSIAFASLTVLTYILTRIRGLNRAADDIQRGDTTVKIVESRLPVLGQTARHYRFLSMAVTDLEQMEKFQQRMLAYEKKEMEYLLETEALSRQLKKQLEETSKANRTAALLNLELEDRNRSLNEAINRLSALNQVSRMLGMEHDRQQIYRMVVSLPMELLGAEIGHLLLYSEEDDDLVMEYSVGLADRSESRRRINVGDGMAGWVAGNRKPLLIEDFAQQETFSPISSLGYERKTAISVPIMTKDEFIGAITLINRQDGQPFQQDEMTLLATIASEAAMALHNVLLLEKIQKSYFSMVQALITAVEAKDVYTRGHSERVTQYSLLIAEQMNLPLSQMEIIHQAGILHDIGKITVELSILNKPTRLSPAEYEKIKNHPAVGYRILEPIEFDERIKLCVLQHHERPDGKGYPNGASAADILLEAKVLAAADAFDAMTTSRPYRDALTIHAALNEIQRCSGTQFDPQVVEVLGGLVNTMISSGVLETLHS
ncbi:MAG: HD domain-containing protein [bacterium]|nr:MAG: HD domain-containing protein [bacterium]